MLTAILSWIFNGVSSLVSGYFNNQQATTQSIQSVAVAETVTRGQVETATMSHWWTALPIIAIMCGTALYYLKCVVWDTMLGLGSTPELHGQVAEWMDTTIRWGFGYGGIALISKSFGR